MKVKCYIHRLGHNPISIKARGIDGLVLDNNPHLIQYRKRVPNSNSLYWPVGQTTNPNLVQPMCVNWSRNWAMSNSANQIMVTRLLTIRTEWSRK